MDDAAPRKIECFEDLIIWQRAVDFAAEIYKITNAVGFKSDFGLKDQLRRAAVSISSNIAEGFERRSRNEYLNFLNIAKGSAGETRSMLEIATRVGYLTSTQYEELRERSKFLSGSITNHMKSISSPQS
jgi:four helix bundle protein